MAVKLKSQNIPCIYPNEPAVLIATGPSLTPEVIETVRKYKDKVKVFGCNNAYEVVDFLDVFYACDGAWWDRHPKVLEKLPETCHPWTQELRVAQKLGVNFIKGSHAGGLCISRADHIHYGSNSGFQQLNIAWHYGCRKFFLVGYDMRDVNGKTHFFGDHPVGLAQKSPYDKFIQYFGTIPNHIKKLIINCTPGSALTHFVNSDLEEELSKL